MKNLEIDPMIEQPLHTATSAPASRAIFHGGGGEPSNLMRTLAESPATLSGFSQLGIAFSKSSLSPLEQQVVYLSASRANSCHYCTAQQGPFDYSDESREACAAIVGDRPIEDPRLQALRRFTQSLTNERGWVAGHEVDVFLDAGFDQAQVLEVICGISLATLASYTNHIAATPLDGSHPMPS